jgi:hypothetical protein
VSTQPKLTEAIDQIDKALGRGYAREHPELVASYLVSHSIRELDETLSTSAQSFLNLAGKAGSISNIMKLAPGLFKSVLSE